MPGGRPTKYRPEMCEQIVDLMRNGESIEEASHALNLSKDTVYQYAKKYPEFSDALKRAVQVSYVWWLRNGREALREKEFNYTGFYMQMKNRFGWTDKKEIKHEGETSRVVIEIPKEEK